MTDMNRICVWYPGTAAEAAAFYVQTFPDSSMERTILSPGEYPNGREGDVLMVEFTVCGIPCVGLNGGPEFPHTQAFSFSIRTEDQQETDRLWDAIVSNGGEEIACGWCRDRWGVLWQITPSMLLDAITDPDRDAARRAFLAMGEMVRIDITGVEAALRG